MEGLLIMGRACVGASNIRNEKIPTSLLSCSPELLPDPKKTLDDALDIGISGDRIRIASDFGEYIDMSAAEARSLSFSSFMQGLQADDLL